LGGFIAAQMIKRRNIMKVIDFVQSIKDKKVMNTKLDPNGVENYIRDNLEIKEYIPFKDKRMIAEMVVSTNTVEIDGVKKHDAISAYVGFVVAMLTSHTNLEMSDNPVADYDLLAENGLLIPIIETFRADYTECDILLKMALAYEMEDNNVGAVVGRFLNGIYNTLDGIGDVFKDTISGFDFKEILGDIKQEDLAKLSSLLDKSK
jgi:hypothetical protein